ncbi:MAG: hypothetical protein RL173_970 [Fibrobacterota bacterium]|jgi:indolepyruvate ferredoxin oxidoreductase alpha subunit
MHFLKRLLLEPPGQKLVLQGNAAFALGVLRAGYHSADGYPGTPSTEVLDALREVPEMIKAEWSVNEAVAVGVALGHAIAGRDALVTMKVPGLFQGADVVASAASSKAATGALVLYVATDNAPSSSQYLVDARHFLSSLHVPVLEPRNHQEMHEFPRLAADLSREFSVPVVILASSVLCHAEGIVVPREQRIVEPRPSHAHQGHVLLPSDALNAFRNAVQNRTPRIAQWVESSSLHQETPGSEDFGIVATGEAALIVQEALVSLERRPALLTLGITNPLPESVIRDFAQRHGSVVLFEDGERFVEGKLRQMGLAVSGKEQYPTVTNWTPDLVARILSERMGIEAIKTNSVITSQGPRRPPSICPGCPYKAVGMAIRSLKRRKLLDLVFGDIGCSTLLHHQDALDVNLCMGASESMRQGYVLSNPASASRVISMIGDSSECHSGMDATRNAVHRRIPGVKVILDNRAIAMTGAQSSPTSRDPETGATRFDLAASLEAEGARALKVDAYDETAVESALAEALRTAGEGAFTTLVLQGSCIEASDRRQKSSTLLEVDTDLCVECGSCDICQGIAFVPGSAPRFTDLCTRCGEGAELCVSACPVAAISVSPRKTESVRARIPAIEPSSLVDSRSDGDFPDALRVAICGVGGQGNLFLGKVLAQVLRTTPYIERNMVKGEVHGMAQKGGTVCSTFACGDVHSPVFAAGSVDFLVVMERGEVLRPEFLRLLKPDGTILLNDHAILPDRLDPSLYPDLATIKEVVAGHPTLVVRASEIAPRNANAVLLGLLSLQAPFDLVGIDAWLKALERLSPTDAIRQGNLYGFAMGRQKASELATARPQPFQSVKN